MAMSADPTIDIAHVDTLNIESKPRRFRRWFSRYAKRFAQGFAGTLFVFMAAMYAWRFYFEVWPLLMPLLASNPAFFYATVVLMALGGLMILLYALYVLFS